MQDNIANNKRIAKSTMLLYVRMMFIMVVQLYTSRIVLSTLGVVDYGIYNVVGGIVAMFAFLNGAMINSTQRYITFELGKGDVERLKVVFSTCIQIHFLVAIIIVFLGETLGLWFLYEKMMIPEERFSAAMWVYQLSVFTMCVQVLSVPFNSDIIAHEKMSAFAGISIIEVVLKLLIVYLLVICSFDKLVLYAILVAWIQLVIQYVYMKYCHLNFVESHIVRTFDVFLVKEMGKFLGWNIWGNLAGALYGAGLNLLLNVFYGPIVNAARAVAVQVESAIHQFSTNFQMAANPQITKLYAKNEMDEMHKLLFRVSRFTCYLLFILSLPVVLETDAILSFWLKNVPDYTVPFLRLLLCIAIVNSTAGPLMTAAAATGNVKIYQTLIGGILLLIVPISYVVLKKGGSPSSVYVVYLLVSIVAFFVRLLVLKSLIKMPIKAYFINVIARCSLVCSFSLLFALLVKCIVGRSCGSVVFNCLLSVIISLLIITIVGLTKKERQLIISKIWEVIGKSRVIIH